MAYKIRVERISGRLEVRYLGVNIFRFELTCWWCEATSKQLTSQLSLELVSLGWDPHNTYQPLRENHTSWCKHKRFCGHAQTLGLIGALERKTESLIEGGQTFTPTWVILSSLSSVWTTTQMAMKLLRTWYSSTSQVFLHNEIIKCFSIAPPQWVWVQRERKLIIMGWIHQVLLYSTTLKRLWIHCCASL